MAKALKLNLEKQHREIRKAIFNDLAQLRFLNSPNRAQFGTPAEIFARAELLKKHVEVLVMKRQKFEFWLELLTKTEGTSFHPAINHEYPIFFTKILHYN
jgi:hypothetical protein